MLTFKIIFVLPFGDENGRIFFYRVSILLDSQGKKRVSHTTDALIKQSDTIYIYGVRRQ